MEDGRKKKETVLCTGCCFQLTLFVVIISIIILSVQHYTKDAHLWREAYSRCYMAQTTQFPETSFCHPTSTGLLDRNTKEWKHKRKRTGKRSLRVSNGVRGEFIPFYVEPADRLNCTYCRCTHLDCTSSFFAMAGDAFDICKNTLRPIWGTVWPCLHEDHRQ